MKKLVLLLLVWSISASAAKYQPMDSMVFGLGRGINPQNLDEAQAECVNYGEVRSDLGTSNDSVKMARISMRVIKSERELAEAIGVDFKLKARYAMVKGRVSASSDVSSSYNSNSVTMVISYLNKYSEERLVGITPKPELRNLPPGKIIQKCGTEIVESVQKESSVHAVVSFLNTSSRSAVEKTLDTYIGGKGIVTSVEAAATIKKIQNTFSSAVDISAQFSFVGGRGVGEDTAASLPRVTMKELHQLPEALEKISKTFNRQNASATAYLTLPIEKIFISAPRYEDFAGEKLSLAYERLLLNKEKMERLESIFENSSLYQEEKIESLKVMSTELNDYINELFSFGERCARENSAASCGSVPARNIVITWPSRLGLSCEQKVQGAWDLGLINNDIEFNTLLNNGLIPSYMRNPSDNNGRSVVFSGYVKCKD